MKFFEHNGVKDAGVLGGTGAYFGTAIVNMPTLSQCIGVVTLTLGILRLIEVFTGKKISELIKTKKGNDNE